MNLNHEQLHILNNSAKEIAASACRIQAEKDFQKDALEHLLDLLKLDKKENKQEIGEIKKAIALAKSVAVQSMKNDNDWLEKNATLFNAAVDIVKTINSK